VIVTPFLSLLRAALHKPVRPDMAQVVPAEIRDAGALQRIAPDLRVPVPDRLFLQNKSVDSSQFYFSPEGNNGAFPLQDGFEGNTMQSFLPVLFDHLDADDGASQGQFRARSKKADERYSVQSVRSAP
jgi:hypothetical protein